MGYVVDAKIRASDKDLSLLVSRNSQLFEQALNYISATVGKVDCGAYSHSDCACGDVYLEDSKISALHYQVFLSRQALQTS